MTENLSFFEENAAKVTGIVTKRSNVNSMVTTFLKAIRKVDGKNDNNIKPILKPVEEKVHD